MQGERLVPGIDQVVYSCSLSEAERQTTFFVLQSMGGIVGNQAELAREIDNDQPTAEAVDCVADAYDSLAEYFYSLPPGEQARLSPAQMRLVSEAFSAWRGLAQLSYDPVAAALPDTVWQRLEMAKDLGVQFAGLILNSADYYSIDQLMQIEDSSGEVTE